MVDVYLNDDKFKYEVETLIQLFITPSSFRFIGKEALEGNQSFLLTIYVTNDHEDLQIRTAFFKNGETMHQVNEKEVINYNKPITKKEIKDGVKKSIYIIFEKVYAYSPPWGILTGIRPSKIVNEMMDQNINEEEIIEHLREHYKIQEEKISLLMKVCQNERPILNNSVPNGVSLYIGIPFCPSKCIYCSFTSYPADEYEVNQYLVALKKEIQYVGQELKNGQNKIETIYIGGGTPTVLSQEQLKELLEWIHEYFDLKFLKEFTVECGRPDTITHQKLDALKAYGVDRISINPQTMKAETLRTIGRKHTPEQIKEAFIMARDFGFKSINADLITGLPHEDLEDFRQSLETLIDLGPQNITVHTLALKKASRLKQIREEYRYMSETCVKDMLKEASRLMAYYEYHPYYLYRQKYISGNFENIGYCKEGHECIYNIRIMEEKQTIIALGAGAVSKVYFEKENRLERVPNVSNYEIYMGRIDEMIHRKKGLIFANIDNKNNNTL
ncbi:MAG: coproporphyrinogen dehydrogenase HemZ [Clostridia bacterium]|nr:coproporphyrinogen dehydrogenase HemZ [Clostridia bacterium]